MSALALAASLRPYIASGGGGGGTVSLVGVSHGGGYGASPASEPPGAQDGDLLVAYSTVFDYSSSRTLACSGFTFVGQSPVPTGFNEVSVNVWKRTRSGAAGNVQVTGSTAFLFQNGTNAATTVLAFRGSNGTPDVAIVSSGYQNPVGTSDYSIASFSVPSNGSYVAVCVGDYNDPGTITGGGLTWTNHGGAHFEALVCTAPANAGTISGVASSGSDGYGDSWVVLAVSPQP